MSTVSGGGYMGGSLSWYWSGQSSGPSSGNKSSEPAIDLGENFPYGTEHPGEPTTSPLLRFLRGHGNYLTPGEGIGFSSLASVVIRGAFLNLFVWLPWMALFWLVLLIAAQGLLIIIAPPSAFTHPPEITPPDVLTWLFLAIIAIVAIRAAIYAVCYSWFTAWEHKSQWKYRFRRFYEALSGGWLKLCIFGLVVAGIPAAESLAASIPDSAAAGVLHYGGPGWIVFGLILGYMAYSKSSKEGSAAPLVYGAAGIVLFVFGVLVSTFDMGNLVFLALKQGFVSRPWPYYFEADTILIAYLVFLALSLVTMFKVNINYISVHRYYRDRLMEAFMPDMETAVNDRTGPAFRANDAALNSFAPGAPMSAEGEAGRPYHLVNTNAILPDS